MQYVTLCSDDFIHQLFQSCFNHMNSLSLKNSAYLFMYGFAEFGS